MPFRGFLPGFAAVGILSLASYGQEEERASRRDQSNPAIQQSSAWVISEAPSITIGGDPLDPDHQLYRVVDATFLSDGTIVVADQGASEVRIYGEDGKFLRVFGREGDGPGEFRRIADVGVLPGDTIFVVDAAHRRISLYDPHGRFGRSIPAKTPDTRSIGSASYITEDRSWILREEGAVLQAQPGTLVRDTISFWRMASDGKETRRILELPAQYSTALLIRGNVGVRTAPFTPKPVHAVLDGHLLVSSAEDSGVTVLTRDGKELRRFELPIHARSLSEGQMADWIEVVVAALPELERPMARRVYADVARLPFIPVYSDLVVDENGFIWLQSFTPPFGDGVDWTVVSAAGELVCKVRAPQPMKILEIGEDFLLGLTWGKHDEHIVKVFDLRKNTHREVFNQPFPVAR